MVLILEDNYGVDSFLACWRADDLCETNKALPLSLLGLLPFIQSKFEAFCPYLELLVEELILRIASSSIS
jgi:hypothetical protein